MGLVAPRFTQGPGDGPIEVSTPRGSENGAPYVHDGRRLTLDDTVESFNLIMGLKLTPEERKDLVAFIFSL